MNASTYNPLRLEFLFKKILKKLLYNLHIDPFAKSLPPIIFDVG